MILTLDIDWNPTVLEYSAEGNKEWFDTQTGIEEGLNLPLFDEFSNYRNRTNIGEYELYFFNSNSYSESSLDNVILEYIKHSNLGYLKVNNK